jgi:hypothetical protein
VAIAQFALAACFIFFPSKKKFWRGFSAWSFYGFVSCAIGFPLTYPYWVRQAMSGIVFVRFEKFWGEGIFGEMKFPLIEIWWKSLGPFGLVMFFCGWISATAWQMKFWGSSMVVWLITSYVAYQPWLMDNLKLLFAAWTPIAIPFVLQFYVWVYRRSRNWWIRAIVVVLVVQGSFSGILSYHYEVILPLWTISRQDYAVGQWISENTPVDAVFLSYSSTVRFNPASCLAGRQLFIGYEGWMAQHGVAGPNRALSISKLLVNTADGQKFADEAVSYVLVKWNESLVFPLKANDQAWEMVYRKFPFTIYKLRHKNIALPEHMRPKSSAKVEPVFPWNENKTSGEVVDEGARKRAKRSKVKVSTKSRPARVVNMNMGGAPFVYADRGMG